VPNWTSTPQPPGHDSAGAGETPIIVIAPAIGNAVFQARPAPPFDAPPAAGLRVGLASSSRVLSADARLLTLPEFLKEAVKQVVPS